MTKAYADLHLHTVASDGTQTFDTLVRRAKATAFDCIAVTDHDIISADLTSRVTSVYGVEVITGVEVKAMFGDVAGELLGYFVDPHHAELKELLGPLSASRDQRMMHMVELCREHLQIDITYEEVLAESAGGNVGRPHLARVLLEKGAIADFQEAFATLIGKGCPCYYAIDKPDFRDAVRILKAAGGAISVAHPCLMTIPNWDVFLDELMAAGVDGMETIYPYDPLSRNLSIEPWLLAEKAKQHGFLVTGGSDDHGPGGKESLGMVRVPYEHVEALKKVAGL
ncbi:PHP domain-containing protein [Candidatus Bipolaricaulota bacterium]|nr:PHP domain-containing protein [Candidatus Bipolaricaulota bacterium]